MTQQLLNAAPIKPSTPAEVELMLKCVVDAQKAKLKKGQSVWNRASDIYLEAFIHNCAVPEEDRLLIRSCGTIRVGDTQ